MAPTIEALNQHANTTTTLAETMTTHIPTILIMIIITAILTIYINADTAKEPRPEKQNNERKQQKTKEARRNRSATPNRGSVKKLKEKAQNDMDEEHSEGRLALETTLAKTWKEIHGHARQRFEVLEDHAWTNYNDNDKDPSRRARSTLQTNGRHGKRRRTNPHTNGRQTPREREKECQANAPARRKQMQQDTS